jgi:hypothetical protein
MTDDNFVVMVDLGAREVAARFEAWGQISEIPLNWDPRTVETTVRAFTQPHPPVYRLVLRSHQSKPSCSPYLPSPRVLLCLFSCWSLATCPAFLCGVKEEGCQSFDVVLTDDYDASSLPY